jgi:hypothetical protein
MKLKKKLCLGGPQKARDQRPKYFSCPNFFVYTTTHRSLKAYCAILDEVKERVMPGWTIRRVLLLYFEQFLCRSSGVFHRTHNNGVWCSFLNLLVSCPQNFMTYIIPFLCVQWKTPDNGQRNRPKHVEIHSKNKFEKLVHPVGFIVRNSSHLFVNSNLIC